MARHQRAFYRLATGVIVVGLLYWAKDIFVPVALAILFAFALTPPAAWLERKGLARAWSSLVVAALALALVAGLGWVAGSQVRQLVADLPQYQGTVVQKVRPLLRLAEGLERAEEVAAPTPEAGEPAATSAPVPVTVVKPSGSAAVTMLPAIALPVAHMLASALLVIVMTVFLLIQRETTRDRLLALAGRNQLTTTTKALGDAAERVSRYLLLQASTNAAMGVVAAVGLYFIGVPYAPLWGLLTAVLRFVPYVGIWISALFPMALALAVLPGWGPALLVLAVYAGFDLLLANVIEPLLFGHGTGVSALALLIAAAFWAFLWGAVGLLLAIPLTVCLVVLGEHVPSLKFLLTLLGDEPQVDPAARYFHRVLSRQADDAAVLVREQAEGRPLLEVYDGTILPALAQAKAERDAGDLSPDDEREFYRVTRDVLTGVLAPHRAEAEAGTDPARPAARLVGCSTKGEADRLALIMLRDIARSVGCEVEIVPAARLARAVRAARERGEDVTACVGAVSPGGLAQAAGLCKDVRRITGARVIVGRWGMTGDAAATERFLTDAGAEKVTWTLRETLAVFAPDLPPPEPRDAVTAPAEPGQVTVPV